VKLRVLSRWLKRFRSGENSEILDRMERDKTSSAPWVASQREGLGQTVLKEDV
jgi:hypothetical protein